MSRRSISAGSPIEAMIGRRAEALDEGDGAGGHFTAFAARLPDPMRRNDPASNKESALWT
jgi:hypothetical protein